MSDDGDSPDGRPFTMTRMVVICLLIHTAFYVALIATGNYVSILLMVAGATLLYQTSDRDRSAWARVHQSANGALLVVLPITALALLIINSLK